MNLLIYGLVSLFGIGAIKIVTIILHVLGIIGNIALICAGAISGLVWAVIRIVLLIVFVHMGFPINVILWSNLILDLIGSIVIVVDPINGGINIVSFILDIIGTVLFYKNLL